MTDVRAALYLDFDNVFSGLMNLDPEVGLQFAKHPLSWVARLTSSLTVDGHRRWLILRCYMNPSGWWAEEPPPGAQPDRNGGKPRDRLYFSRFREGFTRAGFEVIDCPRLSSSKNAADIRMVIDAMDALNAGIRYDEFVVASGDADMTPLIVRLRAADRRTTIISPSDAAVAFTSVADRLIDAGQVLALVQGEQPDEEPPEIDLLVPVVTEVSEPSGDAAAVDGDAYRRFSDEVTRRYADSTMPLNLAELSTQLRIEHGKAIDATSWFGSGNLTGAIRRLDLSSHRMSLISLWDTTRHLTPADPTDDSLLPDPVARLSALGLPNLPRATWPLLYDVLAEYGASHHFNLTESTRWTRDRLREDRGVSVGRNVVAFVIRGSSYGGAPLHRSPSPSSSDIATAFTTNLLNRAASADIQLSDDEARTVREWLGSSDA